MPPQESVCSFSAEWPACILGRAAVPCRVMIWRRTAFCRPRPFRRCACPPPPALRFPRAISHRAFAAFLCAPEIARPPAVFCPPSFPVPAIFGRPCMVGNWSFFALGAWFARSIFNEHAAAIYVRTGHVPNDTNLRRNSNSAQSRRRNSNFMNSIRACGRTKSGRDWGVHDQEPSMHEFSLSQGT